MGVARERGGGWFTPHLNVASWIFLIWQPEPRGPSKNCVSLWTVYVGSENGYHLCWVLIYIFKGRIIILLLYIINDIIAPAWLSNGKISVLWQISYICNIWSCHSYDYLTLSYCDFRSGPNGQMFRPDNLVFGQVYFIKSISKKMQCLMTLWPLDHRIPKRWWFL